jgi:gliding motility-associated-like protein
LLDTDADTEGTFTDLDNTNALNGSIVDLSLLSNNSYHFQYDVQVNTACESSSAIITINVEDVAAPTITDQSFCIGYGAKISDLEISANYDSFNWYNNIDDEITLDTDTILQDGEDYYVAAVNENDCESERVKVTITLVPFGEEGCVSCINDGVSANDDGENDELELCDLPAIFPNYHIKIFNRYGNTIYNGNINTSLFNGTSNVDLTIGDQVPSGVYFYIFNPNDGVTKPFQGDFYLSR